MPLDEDVIRADVKDAMRARDTLKTKVLRNVLAALKNKSIELGKPKLGEDEILAVVQREAKQCGESLEFARQAERDGTVREHEAELRILTSYLPRQLDETALRSAVRTVIADTGATSIGPIMTELGKRHRGCYDGKLASQIVKEELATG